MPTRTKHPARAVRRALFRSCPLCGEPRIFNSWFQLKKECPRCGLDFEREPGWWIGGMIFNLAGAMFLFALVFGLGLILFWPDVPWLGIAILSATLMVAFPIFFYPMSKTLWLAVDLIMVGMDRSPRT